MPELSDAHRRRLDEWLGSWEIAADYSWPLQDTAVLRVTAGERDLIVKASAASGHMHREIAAHRDYLHRFHGWVPRLAHSSVDDLILVTEYLPGELVDTTHTAAEPATYRRAGERLRALLIPGRVSPTYADEIVDRALHNIDAAARLVEPTALQALRARLRSTGRPDAQLYFTHGDFQPRNWLLDGDELNVIDFGRADQRPWTSELVRMNNDQFLDHPELESAFHAGLGRATSDEDVDLLALETILQSITTVVWAHGIGDDRFEEHGRRMIDRLLSGR